MPQFGGKNAKKTSSDSKRHFTVVIDRGKEGTNVPPKEHGLYVSSTPSSAAKKAVTKLCAANKSKKVEFHIREITQGSKKKTYGPYIGYIEKLKEPIELKDRVIKYKPIAKLSRTLGAKKGGMMRGGEIDILDYYKQTVGLVKHSVYREKYGTGVVKNIKESYSDKVISERDGLISRFNQALQYFGTENHGLKYYIDMVKTWSNHIELIFVLALEHKSDTLRVTPYLLANLVTIYPFCLRFVCRLVLNDMFKEKEDLYCLLKQINYNASLYWNLPEGDKSIRPDINPVFTPYCLLVGYLQFPHKPTYLGVENTLDTFFAWFGIMNPNELGGLNNTKDIIMNFISSIREENRINILKQFNLLTQMPKIAKSIIKENYNGIGNTLTVLSIAELLLKPPARLLLPSVNVFNS
jgi:hypothetical protein